MFAGWNLESVRWMNHYVPGLLPDYPRKNGDNFLPFGKGVAVEKLSPPFLVYFTCYSCEPFAIIIHIAIHGIFRLPEKILSSDVSLLSKKIN